MQAPDPKNTRFSLRRRSTHIYHSIIVEADETSAETEPCSSKDHAEDLSPAVPISPGPWKIFILTNSVTNYFCCGYNITRGIANLQKISPLTSIQEKLGGEEAAGIKKKFMSSLADWILDLGTTVDHLLRFSWVDAALTYLIVLVCGFISTIGFLRYSDIRLTMKHKAKEMGFLWILLLFIPTFFSIVSSRLWLSVVSEHYFLTTKARPWIKNANQERVAQLEELKTKLKDWTLKAVWLETVLEAKPQAVLQTMFLVERSLGAETTISDYSPVLLSLWTMHSVTASIYELVVLKFVDRNGTFTKLYGYSYTVLSTMAPAFLMSVSRKLATSEEQGFLITIASLGIYYVVFEVIYQITYLICTLLSTDETTKQSTFVKLYTPVLILIFSSCATVWGFVSATNANMVKIQIVIGIFTTCLLINVLSCFKVFEFVQECFRLKNVKIDEAWLKFKSKSEEQ